MIFAIDSFLIFDLPGHARCWCRALVGCAVPSRQARLQVRLGCSACSTLPSPLPASLGWIINMWLKDATIKYLSFCDRVCMWGVTGGLHRPFFLFLRPDLFYDERLARTQEARRLLDRVGFLLTEVAEDGIIREEKGISLNGNTSLHCIYLSVIIFWRKFTGRIFRRRPSLLI